ncbi:porin family protein [Zhouia sp. PK063]|uniref:porin family protein n=1 Tax=Zhouia sp. PK063 TaxID=3373602 RepID=UPI0037B05D43
MKKFFLGAALAVFAITGTYAQVDKGSPSVGAKGGVNISTFTGDDIGEKDTRTSFNAGLVFELPVSERFSIQPEVLYSAQGYTILKVDQENFADVDDNTEYQLDYIQVPVLAKIYLVDGLSVEAGPSFNFKVNEEIDRAPTEDGGDIDISNEDSNINDFEFGLAGGLSYKFNNGFFLSGRYSYGVTKLIKDSDADIHNSVWQFGLGFMF